MSVNFTDMNLVERNYKIASDLAGNGASSVLVMLFKFSTEVNAKEFYMEIYHWQHHDQMIEISHKEDQYYAGINVPCSLDLKHLKVLTDCYSGIASGYKGRPEKWRLKIKYSKAII